MPIVRGFDVVRADAIAGKPAPTVLSVEHTFYEHCNYCGSRLASDEARSGSEIPDQNFSRVRRELLVSRATSLGL
jgi:hypothetical protein